jgi:hypothetical protein
MKDLISAVSEFAQNDAELLATVVWMVNSGSVRLGGDRPARHGVRPPAPEVRPTRFA